MRDLGQIFNKSIVLIGPVGVGKSAISGKLQKETSMKVVSMDLLRHCPKNLESIENHKRLCEEKMNNLRQKLEASDPKTITELEREIERLNNDIWVSGRQIEMRKLLPNVPNYEEMGFDGKVSDFLEKNYGAVGWHFYQKQFENTLLEAVIEQLSEPVILDFGGGMAISLDRDYEKLDKIFKEKNAELYRKHFKLGKIGFNRVKKTLRNFKKVVYLKLPRDYKQLGGRASRAKLNDAFISTGQYNELATITVDTAGLFQQGRLDEKKLSAVANTILGSRTSATRKELVD